MVELKKLLILVTTFCTHAVSCANILALLGVASPSHHIWNSVLINELAARGHNITVLSVDLPRNPATIPKNVHYIYIEGVYDHLYRTSEDNLLLREYIGISLFEVIPFFYRYLYKVTEGIFKSDGLNILFNYPDDFKFDLVIYDYTIGSCMLGFLHKFNYPPLVGITAFHNPPNTMDLVGGHYFPAYIPYHSSEYDTQMSFPQRLHNTLVYLADTLYRWYIFTPTIDKWAKKRFPYDIPYLADLEKRTALVLVNSHPAVNYPEPLPPNVIEVGGLQLVDPEPLPKDLELFINSSKSGAILFSLGTNMRSEEVGPENCKIILEVMKQLPEYNFLWKFDLDMVKYQVSKNVLIRSFFPQRDILAHPKIKAFVTHAGGLSTQEATWRGVPMIGLALFADQPRNLQKAILAGVAERVDYLTLSVKSLRDTIKKVVEDKRYSENMKIRSKFFRDRPMKPLDTAVWWIEYVLRNPHPNHLRSPVLELGFWRANSFDVIFTICGVLFLFIFIFYKIVRMCIALSYQHASNNIDTNKKIN